MARNVPRDEPLSPEDREYLESRGEHERVAAMDAEFGTSADDEPDGGTPLPPYEEWTVAELEKEVADRRQDGAEISLRSNPKKADYAAALRADDQKSL